MNKSKRKKYENQREYKSQKSSVRRSGNEMKRKSIVKKIEYFLFFVDERGSARCSAKRH